MADLPSAAYGKVAMRLIHGTLAAVLMSAVASVTAPAAHAATYARFSSRTCPYKVDYPVGWRIQAYPKNFEDTYTDNHSATAQVSIICPKAQAGMTVQSATSLARSRLQQLGFGSLKVQNAGATSIITGNNPSFNFRGRRILMILESTVTLHGGKVWMTGLVGDATSFRRDLPLYVHMLSTFNGK